MRDIPPANLHVLFLLETQGQDEMREADSMMQKHPESAGEATRRHPGVLGRNVLLTTAPMIHTEEHCTALGYTSKKTMTQAQEWR